MNFLGPWKRAMEKCAGAVILMLAGACVSPAQQPASFSSNFVSGSIGNFSMRPILTPSLAMTAPAADSNAAGASVPPAPRIYGPETKWELEAGAVFTRFRSSIFYASMPGFKASVAYHLNDWLAAEGGITTGFAPEIFVNEHVKYFDYTVGLRMEMPRERFTPWAHAQIGGAHILPQTANSSQNAYAFKAGIGVDYRLNLMFSLRAQTDWLRTGFFGESQNNFQGAAGVIIHF